MLTNKKKDFMFINIVNIISLRTQEDVFLFNKFIISEEYSDDVRWVGAIQPHKRHKNVNVMDLLALLQHNHVNVNITLFYIIQLQLDLILEVVCFI